MKITVTDPQLLAQLAAAGESVELADETGRVVARVVTDWPGKLPPGARCPIPDEEMDRRRRENRTGRPLADILRDLQARG